MRSTEKAPGVSPATLHGVVEQVRTALTVLVSEILATMQEGTDTPPADVASNALAVAVGGKRNVVNVTSGSTVTTSGPTPDTMRWIRIAGAIIVGLVGIAAAVFGLMQVQDWSF